MSDPPPETAVCLGCGYSLRGLSEPVCPECGRAFIPGDRTTFKEDGGRLSWRRWACDPRAWHVISAPLLTVAYLCCSTKPGGLLGALDLSALLIIPAGMLLLFILGIDYAARVVAINADRRRASLDKAKQQHAHWLRWFVLPVCVAVLISAVISLWPMRIRFHLSLEAFEDAVYSVQTGKDPGELPRQIGSYRVMDVGLTQPGDVFFLTGYSGLDRVGFLYGPDDQKSGGAYIRLAPCWFAVMY